MSDRQSCKAGKACRDSRVQGGQRVPADTDGVLCQGCVNALRRAVRSLLHDYSALAEVAGERSPTGELTVSMTPDPAVPVNVHALALQDELAQWCEAALVVMCTNGNAVRQKAKGYPVRNGLVVARVYEVLRKVGVEQLINAQTMRDVRLWDGSGTTWALTPMDGPSVAVRMIRVHDKVKGIVGEDNPRKRLAMPCPAYDCGMPTLGIDNGDDAITCLSCGRRWEQAEYDFLAGMITADTSEKEVRVLKEQVAQQQSRIQELEELCANQDDMLAKVKILALHQDLSQFDLATIQAYLAEIIGTWTPNQWCTSTSAQSGGEPSTQKAS